MGLGGKKNTEGLLSPLGCVSLGMGMNSSGGLVSVHVIGLCTLVFGAADLFVEVMLSIECLCVG